MPKSKAVLQDVFFGPWIDRVRHTVLPYQYTVLNDEAPGAEPSHALENFRIAAGDAPGTHQGMVFQDSDVYKWLEAAAYVVGQTKDPELEARADAVIELIARAQEPDGYLNTYFRAVAPEKKWTNLLRDHELYCAGHFIEAAAAYYEATGKRQALDVACRLADHIDQVFGRETSKRRGYPGHEEIELALIRLARLTGEDRYRQLAAYFIDERGQTPHYFDMETAARKEDESSIHSRYAYSQAHLPVRQQTDAEGHSVRAMYLYAAMADLAAETNDGDLLDACRTLWESTTNRRMYITGGIGSQAHDEGFTTDYDLPGDTAYTETCAAIGLVFWAHRMLRLERDGRYASVLERALYNGVLAGMAQDGQRFFYVNPLEVWPQACKARHDLRHVMVERQAWFRCACCPPNIARLLASLQNYVYTQQEGEIAVHLYLGSTANFTVSGVPVTVEQTSELPWKGDVRLRVLPDSPVEFSLALRLPDWCDNPSLQINGKEVDIENHTAQGYVYIQRLWQRGDQIQLELPLHVMIVEANPLVRENAGRVALQRGPLVYCLEETDNGTNLRDLRLADIDKLSCEHREELLEGITVITGQATRSSDAAAEGPLYRPVTDDRVPAAFTAVPYYAWNNRGPGEMLVWLQRP